MKNCVLIILRDGELEDVVNIIAEGTESIEQRARSLFEERAREIHTEEGAERLALCFQNGAWDHGDTEILIAKPRFRNVSENAAVFHTL